MKKVILATDGSKFSEEAAWFLSHLPHRDKLELIVVTVVELPTVNRGFPTSDWIERTIDREKFLALENFAEVEALFEGANVSLRHEICEGNRGEAIVQLAEREQVDLIVMGSCGHSNVGRLLLGSTSDFVATHAPCSVLVIRPTGLRNNARPLRIAIGYEAKDPAEKAVKEISEIYWGPEVDLWLVTVLWYVADFFDDYTFDPDLAKKHAVDSITNAAEHLKDVSPNVVAEVIENTHVGEGLVNYAEQHGCDLIVVGDTHRSVMGRFLVGSVSRFVLRHAPCGVWIARQPHYTASPSHHLRIDEAASVTR